MPNNYPKPNKRRGGARHNDTTCVTNQPSSNGRPLRDRRNAAWPLPQRKRREEKRREEDEEGQNTM